MPHPTNPPRRVTIEEPQIEEEAEQQASQQQRAAKPEARKDKEQSRQSADAKFKKTWKVPARYQIKQLLGAGAYGQVAEAHDSEKSRSVAIKQARHLLDDLIDAKRILREVAILGKMGHPNVIRMYDIVVPADLGQFNEIYMVLEMCDSDMKKLCRAEVNLEPLHVTSLLYNLLVGLNYLHSAGIWHRDLKPANCLVNEDCSVKICDFGLSRAMGGDRGAGDLDAESGKASAARNLTGHVVTRWYRAPELILLQETYTEAIDVWSVGCIHAELIQMLRGTTFRDRTPLFPGHTCFPLSPHESHKTDTKYYTKGTKDQLSMICHLIGSPPAEDIALIDGEDAQSYMRCFPKKEGTGIKAKFGHIEKAGSDLLEQMLVFVAARRITVADALNHPLFNRVRSRSRETRAEKLVSLEFEQDQNLDEKSLRKYFLDEVRKFHPEMSQA